MSTNPFPEWLPEVAADEVVCRPEHIGVEAHGNMWTFSLTPEQAELVSVEDVAHFIRGVVATRSAQLVRRQLGPMVFYLWHDAQAGQLRFSLVSKSHGLLPFGGVIVTAGAAEDVISEWLGSRFLDGIPSDELRVVADHAGAADLPRVPVGIWSLTLP